MTAPELIGDVPSRVLAVYAHPDDAEVSCGGTLASWCAAGSHVELLVCTDGGKGSLDASIEVAALVRRRSREVAEAAAVLGVLRVRRLGRPDGELENDVATRGELVSHVRSVRPDAVVCPDPSAVFFEDGYVNHHDHRSAGWATLDAVAPAAASPLYFPEQGEAHQVRRLYLSGSLEPNVFVDVSSTIEQKVAAILCHRSQLGEAGEWSRTVVRERAAEAGLLVGVGFAEAFRRVVLSD